jgi:hypothetical protein
MVAPESRAQIGRLFDAYRDHKLNAFDSGMKTFQFFVFGDHTLEPVDTVSSCILSFVAGVFMASISQDEEFHQSLFDGFIEQCAKDRGENIVDFAQERIKKK